MLFVVVSIDLVNDYLFCLCYLFAALANDNIDCGPPPQRPPLSTATCVSDRIPIDNPSGDNVLMVDPIYQVEQTISQL